MLEKNRISLVSIGLGLGIISALVAGSSSSAMAQFQSGNDNYQSNEKDATYGDAPAGLNPLDLMHRAQQLNGRNAAEFSEDSQSQLDNSVSDYKRLQQQRILEQQQQREAQPVKEIEILQ